VSAPPGLQFFDLAEFYLFRLGLFIIFVWMLYQFVQKKLKG
jgi:hypothetical protein